MNTLDAFRNLMADDELIKKVEMSDTNRRQFLHKLRKAPETLSTDGMKKWLVRAGYIETTEWELPNGAGVVLSSTIETKKPSVETEG